MSTKNPSKQKKKQGFNPNQPNRPAQQQATATATKPKPASVDQQAAIAQENARKEARLQRQADARAEAARRKQQANLRKYGIIGLASLAVVAVIAWLVIREMGKPGESVPVMGDRLHLNAATDPHVPYSTDPPTSGPHTNDVPGFQVYTEPLVKELSVHGIEDGGVVLNYQPTLAQPEIDKLKGIAEAYLGTPGKDNVIMAPYPNLSNPIVLSSWGRIDRLDTLDEARIRSFIDAYVNIDHHEGREGQRIP